MRKEQSSAPPSIGSELPSRTEFSSEHRRTCASSKMGRRHRRKTARSNNQAAKPTKDDITVPKPPSCNPEIGEHYFHTLGEGPPADQYTTTAKVIRSYVFGAGFTEAARTMEAGRDVLMAYPVHPSELDDEEEEVTVSKPDPKKEVLFDPNSATVESQSAQGTAADEPVKLESASQSEGSAPTPTKRKSKWRTDAAKRVYEKELDLYVKSKANLMNGKIFAIMTIWDQCSPTMQAALSSMKGFTQAKHCGDLTTVLNHVRQACHDRNVAGDAFYVLWYALWNLMSLRQRDKESGADYRTRLTVAIKQFEQSGGSLSGLCGVDSHDGVPLTATMKMERMSSMMQFLQSNKGTYSELQTHFFNKKLRGENAYPKTWHGCANMLDHHRINSQHGAARRKTIKGPTSTASPSPKRPNPTLSKRSPSGKERYSGATGHTCPTSSAITAAATATTPQGVPPSLTTARTRTKKRNAPTPTREKKERSPPKLGKREQNHTQYSLVARPRPTRQTVTKMVGTPPQRGRGCPDYSTSKCR